MPKADPGPHKDDDRATREDLHQILGDMDDSTAIAILALHPSLIQLEEARVWLDGGGDVLGKEHRPIDGVVAAIFDMLDVDDEERPATQR